MPRKKKPWYHSDGEKGETVAVWEREPGGIIYMSYPDETKAGGRKRMSLGHRDRQKAKDLARELSKKLKNGELLMEEESSGPLTLGSLFALYREKQTPKKRSAQSRKADDTRIEMWKRFLGPDTKPDDVSEDDCDEFVDARRSGAIDARGNPVPEGERRPVRNRSIEADGAWLNGVFLWAMGKKTGKRKAGKKRWLMRDNPIRGFKWPRAKNPRRPVASHDRYEAVRAVTDEVTMEVRWSGRRETQRSYMSEVFDIAMDTGRRLTPICQLRYSDLRLSEGRHGKIHWPGETDKENREWSAPLAPIARAAIDRVLLDRPGVGSGYLFPSPTDPAEPLSRYLADDWLREAEKRAKLEPQKGSLWHAYRRKWASERKDMSIKDVAAAGGWKSIETVQESYQQVDDATLEDVVLNPRRLREAM